MRNRTFGQGGLNAHLVLLVCTLLFMINYMDRQVLSVVMEPMKLDLGLTDSQAGAIQTVFLMSMAVITIPAAYLVDRWSRRKTIGLMAVWWSIFTFVTGLGRSFWGVLLPRTMVGVGETGFSAGGIAWISSSYPIEKRGRVMGIFYLAIPLGSALGVILGGYISVHFGGWRTPFLWFALPGVILGVTAFFLKDYKTVQEVDDTGRRLGFVRSAGALFRIPSLVYLYFGVSLVNLTTFSILTWLPAYLMRARGIAEDKAGLSVGIIALMALVGAPLGGYLGDVWMRRNPRGRMYLPATAALVATFVLVPALFLKIQGLGYLLALIWGVSAVLVLPPLASASQDVVSPGLKGTSIGVYNLFVFLLGGGWAPWLVGKISDLLGGGAQGLQIALIICSVGGLIGGVLFLIGARHYPADVERVQHLELELEK